MVAWPDGRIIGWDAELQRVSVFRRDGGLEDTWRIDLFALFGHPFAEFLGASPDGTSVFHVGPNLSGMRNARVGVRRDSVLMARVAPDGKLVGEPLRFEGPKRRFYRDGGSWGTDDPLFAREVVGTLAGDTIFEAATDSVHIRRFQGGRELQPLRLLRPPRQVADALVRAERESRFKDAAARAAQPLNMSSRFPRGSPRPRSPGNETNRWTGCAPDLAGVRRHAGGPSGSHLDPGLPGPGRGTSTLVRDGERLRACRASHVTGR